MNNRDKDKNSNSIETPLGPLKIRTRLNGFGKWLKKTLSSNKNK